MTFLAAVATCYVCQFSWLQFVIKIFYFRLESNITFSSEVRGKTCWCGETVTPVLCYLSCINDITDLLLLLVVPSICLGPANY